jgi:hypothetical protein
MLSRQRAVGVGHDQLASHALGLGCAAFLLALRLAAAPAAPANLLATPANARVTVTWNAVIGATGYNVYRSLTPGGPYDSPIATGLTAAAHTDTAVSNDTTYYYVAAAVDGTGEGPRSAEDPATPRVGTFVSGLIGGSSAITTTWTPAGSPYIVVGDVEVRGDVNTGNDRTSTLIIQPGVRVLFEPGTGLFVGDDTGIVSGHSGRLQATGATFTSNRAAPAAGDWKGIRFGDTATDGGTNNFLDGCIVEWAGGGGSAAAVAVSSASPELRNGTAVRSPLSGGVHVAGGSVAIANGEIEGGSAPAVRLLGASSLSLTGTTLRNGTYPVQIHPNVVLSALSGNTAAGYAADRNGIAVEGGLMGGGSAQSRTWPGGDLPYIVLGDLTVRGDANTGNDRTSALTIGTGGPAEVRFNSGAGLFVGDDSGTVFGHSGRLEATRVTFKANAPGPAPGFWKGIYFADTATGGGIVLDGCVVEGAGGAGSVAAVTVNATSLVLRNGTIVRATGTVGLYLSASVDSVATVTGGEIEGGSGPAVRALDRSTLSLTGVALSRGSYPVQIQPNVVIAALSGNTASGYDATQDGIAVEGGLMGGGSAQSRTWPGGDLPYIVLGDLTVRGDVNTGNDRTSSLVIGAGGPAEVRFNSGAGLFIGDDSGTVSGHSGRLEATGVTFKANAPGPAPGFWKGIYFADTATGGGIVLDGCVVEGAGGAGSVAAVMVNATSLVLRNGTTIRATANSGLHLSANVDSAATVTGGEIEGGTGPAVRALDRSTLALTGVTLRSGSYPVQIQPNVVLAALSGNTASGYDAAHDGIAVEGGLMGGVLQSRIWPGGDLPYIVLSDLTVRGNVNTGNDRTSTLVIGQADRPAEVRFNSGAGLTIGSDTGPHGGFSGQLLATHVRFKGNTTSPSAGFWKGIYFADTASEGGLLLDNCVVEDAGGAGSLAAVAVNATSLVLRNGTILRATGNAGLQLSATTATFATVTGGEIEGGTGPAVLALDRSTLALTDVTLRGGTYPVRIQPNVELAALGGNTASGYDATRNGIAVESGLMGGGFQSRTWPGGDLPYIVLGELTIRGNENTGNDRTSTLVIGGPAEVRFDPGAGLTIGSDTGPQGGFSGRLQATRVLFKGNTTTPSPGFWKGLYFAATATGGGIVLDSCVVEGAGGTGAAGAVAVNATSLELRNGTILRNTGNVGLHLSASDLTAATVAGGEIEGGNGPAVEALGRSTLSLSGVTLRGGSYPVRIEPNVILAALNGNQTAGYEATRDGIAVKGGLMGGGFQSRTWPGGDLRYIVLGDLSVRGDQNTGNDRTSTLIIGSPAQVRFAEGAGLFIGDDSGIDGGHWGRLQATNVTFTANTSLPVPGFWKGIYFADQALDGAANNFLDGCTVEWAGGEVSGAVRINASAPVLKNGVAIRSTAAAGVYLSSSSASNLSILGGEIEGGADAAVRATGSSTILLRDVTLRGGLYPMRIDPNVNIASLRGSRVEGYSFERAGVAVHSGLLGGGLQTRVWPAADLPFLVLGELQVRGNQNTGSDRTSTLVLQSGGEVRFDRGASLMVGDDSGIAGGHWGALRASGVTFTANSLSPTPGFWNGLYFADQTRDDLSFLFDCTVEYGGASGAELISGGNVSFHRSSPYLSGVVVRGSGQDGVLASVSDAILTGSRLIGNMRGLRLFSSGSLALADSDVESNSLFGVSNAPTASLFARFNWWGDPSGPLAPANPDGLGDRVSDRVDFTPWLTASALPPLSPAALAARPGNGTVDLTWSANPERDLAGYNVYRRQPPATAWTLRTSSPLPAASSPSFQDGGLSNRVEHCYRVRAVDGQGREGDPSRESCATPKVDATPPVWTGPAGALFAEGRDGRAIVRFEPAADEASTAAYNVYYSPVNPVNRKLSGTGRIANAVVTPSGSGHALEISVPGLINGRRYFFNVQAVDSEGNEDGNAAEATAVVGTGSGAALAAAPWAGATFDGVTFDAQGRAVLAAGRTEGQITSTVFELPPGADLSAIAWNAVQPAGTAVDTVPGGALTVEVRAAEDPAHVADPRCIAPAGLAAWWPGDGNGREIQAGQDGAVRGGTGFATGLSAGAFRFDGTDDRVEVPNFGSFNRVTVQAWIYREGATNTRESIVSYKESDPHCGFVLSLNEDGGSQLPRLFVQVNGIWLFTEGTSPVPLERWTHLAGSYDGQTIRLYVNGILAAATPAAGSMTQCNQKTGIGSRASFDRHYFPGRVDEVAIFDRALTAAEIQALFAAGGSGLCKPDADGDGVADLSDSCPATPARTPVDDAGCTGGCFGPPANRVSWWRGEGNAADSVGTSSGTLVGGTTFDLGQVGQAFRFDGVDDRVEVPNFGSFTRFTVQAWAYREGATNTSESLVSYKEGDNPNCGFTLRLNEDGVSQRPRLWVHVNGIWPFTEATQPFPFGRWTHLAGTYDGQEISLYVDGVLAAVTAAAGNMTQCNQKTGLGMRASLNPSYPFFFPGLLDEITVFDRALSANEIQGLAAARSAGMCATAPPASGAPAGTPQVQQGWVQVKPNQPLDLPDGRYVQVRVTLRGDGTRSPALRSVSLGYRGGGQ